jgi:protoporphyrinogen/coproporphyrinogen III oxidase
VSGGERHVVVIGAGLAGLAAAWRLARSGLGVTLLERASRPGGRAAVHREEGFTLEALPAPLTDRDRHLLDWIDEVGLRDELLPLRPVVTSIARGGSLREVDLRGLADVRKLPGVRLRDALRLVRLPRLLARYGARIDLEAPERAAELDDRSLVDFGRLYFGPSVVERWMAPRLLSRAPGEPAEMSRVQFLHDYRTRGHARPGLLRGVLGDVAERAAAQLEVRLGVEVATIEDRGARGVRVLTRGGTVEADAAVVATDAQDAGRLAGAALTLAERDGLARVRYAAAVTVAAALVRPLGPRPSCIAVPAVEGSALGTAWIEPGLRGGRAPEGRGLALLCAAPGFARSQLGASDDALAKDLLDALDALRPGAARAVQFARVLRVRRAAPRFDVGRYREIARFQRVQADRRAAGRRIYFAGDWLVHPTPEGALVSALHAVAALRADLGS